MYVGYDFDPSDQVENEIYEFDFSPDLAPGETLTAATWNISLVSGADTNLPARLNGSPIVSGSATQQWIQGLVPGSKYLLQAVVTTSIGQELSYWSHVICETPA